MFCKTPPLTDQERYDVLLLYKHSVLPENVDLVAVEDLCVQVVEMQLREYEKEAKPC